MIVFTASADIGNSLWSLVQCWIVAERLGHRLLVRWGNLPADRLSLSPFYDASRHNTTNAFNYTQGAYREEHNKYLLIYYYRRIFAQVLLIRQRPRFQSHYIRLAFWGNDALLHSDTVLTHHRYTIKEIHRFGAETAIESWATFLHLRECDVLVAARSRFTEALLLTMSKKKEWWVVNGIAITLEK